MGYSPAFTLSAIWGYQPKGALNTFTPTYVIPTEAMQGSPVNLPNAKPTGSPQVTFTVVSATKFPTFNKTPTTVKYQLVTWVAGKSLSTYLPTINFELDVNDVSKVTGNLTISTQASWWGFSIFYNDIVDGDVVKVYLWANQVNYANWDYYAYYVGFYEILFDDGKFWQDVVFTANTSSPTLTALTGRSISWTANTHHWNLWDNGTVALASDSSSYRDRAIWCASKIFDQYYKTSHYVTGKDTGQQIFARNTELAGVISVL